MSAYLAAGAFRDYERSWHAELLTAVRRLLDERRPVQVVPAETFVTGEARDVCILVIPHHWLAGTSLVVWSGSEGVEVLWASIHDLRDHEDIDLGHKVARYLRSDPAWLKNCLETVAREFSRRIELRATYLSDGDTPSRLTVGIDDDGQLVQLGLFRFRRTAGRRGSPRDVEAQSSLAALEPPAVRIPVPIAELLHMA